MREEWSVVTEFLQNAEMKSRLLNKNEFYFKKSVSPTVFDP